LVEYAQALSYEELPPEVVERTKCLLLDTVGCALGAAPWQAPSIARALAGPVDVFAGKGGFFQHTGPGRPARHPLLPLKKPASVDDIVDECFSVSAPQAQRIKRRLERKWQRLARVK
jgi:2-methylcitrate dehydratase PrpD